jgi:hypothetical protein
MLTQAVERKVGSIVIVTASSGPVAIPSKWASIPTYDAKSYDGNNELGERVWKETQHVKVPLSQALSARRSQDPSGQGKRTVSWIVAGLLVLVLLVIVGGSITGRLPISNLNRPSSSVSESPTAQANAASTGASGKQPTATTQTVSPSVPEQQAKQKDFDAVTKSNPTVNGFKIENQWDQRTLVDSSCTSTDPTYLATMQTSNQYHICLADKLSYKNFALQVKMTIKGDAGGIIFRSGNAGYYRLSVNGTGDTPAVSLFHCINGQCGANDPNSGKSLGTASAQGDKQSITLTVIARDKNIDVYTDGKLVKSFVAEDPVEAGKIGVHAASLGNPTQVTFSDLKIWSL